MVWQFSAFDNCCHRGLRLCQCSVFDYSCINCVASKMLWTWSRFLSFSRAGQRLCIAWANRDESPMQRSVRILKNHAATSYFLATTPEPLSKPYKRVPHQSSKPILSHTSILSISLPTLSMYHRRFTLETWTGHIWYSFKLLIRKSSWVRGGYPLPNMTGWAAKTLKELKQPSLSSLKMILERSNWDGNLPGLLSSARDEGLGH